MDKTSFFIGLLIMLICIAVVWFTYKGEITQDENTKYLIYGFGVIGALFSARMMLKGYRRTSLDPVKTMLEMKEKYTTA